MLHVPTTQSVSTTMAVLNARAFLVIPEMDLTIAQVVDLHDAWTCV